MKNNILAVLATFAVGACTVGPATPPSMGTPGADFAQGGGTPTPGSDEAAPVSDQVKIEPRLFENRYVSVSFPMDFEKVADPNPTGNRSTIFQSKGTTGSGNARIYVNADEIADSNFRQMTPEAFVASATQTPEDYNQQYSTFSSRTSIGSVPAVQKIVIGDIFELQAGDKPFTTFGLLQAQPSVVHVQVGDSTVVNGIGYGMMLEMHLAVPIDLSPFQYEVDRVQKMKKALYEHMKPELEKNKGKVRFHIKTPTPTAVSPRA